MRARVDLAPLAERLNEAEADAGWRLRHGWPRRRPGSRRRWPLPAQAESALAPGAVRDLVEDTCAAAAPAWDPYRIA